MRPLPGARHIDPKPKEPAMSRFKVVMTSQLFPTVEVEKSLLAKIDASLEVADGTRLDVLQRGRDADALLTHYFSIDAHVIAQLDKCRVIARYGIGLDSIDLTAAAARGIVVTNVPDACVEEVAVHSLSLFLALVRKVVEADRYVRAGNWSVDGLAPVHRLSSLTVGLIGYGKIARRLASTFIGLGCTLLVHDPHLADRPSGIELVALDDLLQRADAVLVHAPLTAETIGVINADRLRLMPPHAVLVNTSRGGLVVLDELLDALRAGTIAGAALDVFDQEPLDPARVGGVPNLILTPHMAYYSEEAVEESQRKAARQVIRVLSGEEPEYRVTPPSA
jgi:D-3-phosphoglycerate dehydrogenase / 2-oxoglutarate reductase